MPAYRLHERGRIVAANERLAHEDGVVPGLGHALGVLGSADRALCDGEGVAGDATGEPLTQAEVLAERPEVARVHADDGGAGGKRTVELGVVVRLDQRDDADLLGELAEAGKLPIVIEGRHDEKHGVGADRPRS